MFRCIVISEAYSHGVNCFKCKNKIGNRSLYARGYSSPSAVNKFHLRCFKPLEAKPLTIGRDVVIRSVWNDKKRQQAEKWVETWNKQFIVTEEKLPAQFLRKAVDTHSTPERRKLLEVFAYLSIPEIEQLAAFTCKSWFHVSRDASFWKAKYLSEFQPTETDADACYRKKYIAMYLGSCWLCHHLVALDQMRLHCPLHRRPLCIACSVTEKGAIVNIREYCKALCVEQSLIQPPAFRVFYNHRVPTAYLSDLSRAMTEYAERRRKALLKCIDEEYSSLAQNEEIQSVRTADLAKIYRNSGTLGTNVASSLCAFLGLNEQRESWKESVENLLEELGIKQ